MHDQVGLNVSLQSQLKGLNGKLQDLNSVLESGGQQDGKLSNAELLNQLEQRSLKIELLQNALNEMQKQQQTEGKGQLEKDQQDQFSVSDEQIIQNLRESLKQLVKKNQLEMQALKGEESIVDQAQLMSQGTKQSQGQEQNYLSEQIDNMHQQFSLKNSYLKDLLNQSIATLNLIKQLTKEQQTSEQDNQREQSQSLYGLELNKQEDLNNYLSSIEKLRNAEIQLEKAAQNSLQNNLTGTLMSIREAFKNFREVYPDCQVFYDPNDPQGQKIPSIQQGMVLLDEFLPKLQEKYIQNLVTLRLCLDRAGLQWDQTEQVNEAYQRYIALFGNGSTQIPQAQGQGYASKVDISFNLKPAVIRGKLEGVKAENVYRNDQGLQEGLKQFMNKIISNLSKILRTQYGFDDSQLLNQIPQDYSLYDQIKVAFEQTQQMTKQAQQFKTQSMQTIELFRKDKPQESQTIFDMEIYKQRCLNQLEQENKSLREQLETAKKNEAMFQDSKVSGDAKLKELISQLQKQNGDLEAQLKDLNQKYSDKCFDYDKLLAQIKQLNDQNQLLQSDLDKKGVQIQSQNDRIKELEDLIKQLQDQVKNGNEQIQSLKKANGDLNDQIAALKNEIQQKNKQLEDEVKAKQNLQQELDKVRPIAQKCNDEAHLQNIKELQDQVNNLNNQNGQLKQSLDQANKKIQDLEDLIKQLQNQLKNQTEQMAKTGSDLDQQVLAQANEIQLKNKQLSDQQKQIEDLENTKNNLLKELERIRPIAQRCESEAHLEKIKELENQNQQLKSSNDAANKKIQELEDALNQLRNQLKQESDKNLQELKTIEDLNSQLAALKSDFQQKLSQYEQKQANDSQSSNSALNDLTNKNKELAQQVADLTAQNEKSKALLDEANKKIKELEDLIKQLQDQLKEQQDKNQKMEVTNADQNQQIKVLKFEIHQKIQNIEELMAWIVEIECTNGSLKSELDKIRLLVPKNKV